MVLCGPARLRKTPNALAEQDNSRYNVMDNNDNKLKEIVTEAAFVKCKLIVILERHRMPSVVTFVVYSMKRESENNFL